MLLGWKYGQAGPQSVYIFLAESVYILSVEGLQYRAVNTKHTLQDEMESDRKGKKLEILGKYLERRKTIKIYTTIFEH
jgi:hypothetical protein